jgi:hypothetical protein
MEKTMKKLCKAAYAFALFVTVAGIIAGSKGYGQTLEELERRSPGPFVDGVEAYIYGYPLLMFGVTGRTATTVPDDHTRLGSAPLNQFGKEMVLPNSSFTAVVLPSTTTLYASSFLNLKTEPVILHIPSIDRFFVLQMLDGWTDVSPMSPSSRLSSKEGDYALVGPDFTGNIPDTVQTVIKMPTNSMWIIGRFYTTGTQSDIDDVINNIYPGLTLTPLSKYINPPYNRPEDLPLEPMVDFITPPLRQVAGMDACAFFGNMAAMMQYNRPIPGQDDAIVPKLKAIGLDMVDTNGVPQPFDCTQYPGRLPTLQLAVAAARALLMSGTGTPPPTKTGWTVALDVGTYDDHYLLRAEVARQALGANNPKDAVYGYTETDGTGANLNGTKNYKIHFDPPGNAEGIPPVNGFWSLTIYDKDGKLVKNDNVSYNAIGGNMVQAHSACFNMDGSLDLYLQPNPPPSGTARCNWLATPDTTDQYIAFLRMYWPKDAILNKDWVPPPIVKTN